MELHGPGKYEVAADTALPLSGSAAVSRIQLSVALRDLKLNRSNLAPAGARMRTTEFPASALMLAPRGIVLSPEALEFRWVPIGGARQYRFQIARQKTEIMYETLTTETRFVLSTDVLLPLGQVLLWRVLKAEANQETTGWQEFVIATPEARALVAQMHPPIASLNLAERNLLDALLWQMMANSK